MACTHTERLQPQIQPRLPRLSRHRRCALARRVVGDDPALVPALDAAGITRAVTLADAWNTGVAAPAHLMNTADPTAAGARRRSIRALACGADLRRGIRAHGTGGPLAPARDAAHRRADVVLRRMRVRYRGAAPPPVPPFMGRFFILPLPDAVAARMEAPPMGQAFSARVQGCTAQREAYP